jgi:hypothetical protein
MPKSPPRTTKAHTALRSVESLIHIIRGQKVMLDADLASLYGVPTKRLNEAVRRNLSRFPESFMFQLSDDEAKALRSQIATSNEGRGGRRYLPFAFTEHGVVMLSSVLTSERAIRMSIQVVNAFVRLRQMTEHHKDIATRMEKLERGHERAASVIEILVEDIDELSREVKHMKALPPPTKRKIGFVFRDD